MKYDKLKEKYGRMVQDGKEVILKMSDKKPEEDLEDKFTKLKEENELLRQS